MKLAKDFVFFAICGLLGAFICTHLFPPKIQPECLIVEQKSDQWSMPELMLNDPGIYDI